LTSPIDVTGVAYHRLGSASVPETLALLAELPTQRAGEHALHSA
jgi:hypothetical protein